jgi:uncharacterized protein HemX
MFQERAQQLVLDERVESAAAVVRSASERIRRIEAGPAAPEADGGGSPELAELRAELEMLEQSLTRERE